LNWSTPPTLPLQTSRIKSLQVPRLPTLRVDRLAGLQAKRRLAPAAKRAKLVAKVPPGQLHSPYADYAKLAKEEDLVKQFRLPGCNECHGGGGGGGMCPALSQGAWFWGNTDDVLFRLITLGSQGIEKQGFDRIQYGTVHAPMPPMGFSIKTSDDLWKIIAFIRSINPPGTNPPEKVVPGRMSVE
jgi:mono/diheme cytochrome c family protein